MQERNLCSQGKANGKYSTFTIKLHQLHNQIVWTHVILQTIKNQLKNVSKIVGNLKVSRQIGSFT